MIVLQPPLFLRKMGWSSSVSVDSSVVQYWWISVGLVIVQLRAVFYPSVQYLSFVCEAFSRTILDSSSFPLFYSGQVFDGLVCPLTVDLSQIFFNFTTLFSYPVFFCLFHTPLDVVVDVFIFLRSLRFESTLSQLIIIRTYIYNALNDALSASRIHNKLKTILSKYIRVQNRQSSVLTVLPVYNH